MFGGGFTARAFGNFFKDNLTEAGRRQEIDANLNVVVDDKAALPQIRKSMEKLSRSGLASYEEYANTAFSLLSAGVNTKDIENATRRVIEVGKVAEGAGGEVAMLMASLQQVYGLDFDVSGDLIAATQGESKFKNFGQLKETLEKSLATAKSVKMNENELFAVAGIFNDNAVEGAVAGTAINATLRQLNKAQKKLGINISRTDNGELDFASILSQIKTKLAPFNQDQQSAILQDIFGDEGKKGILPLLSNIERLREYQDKLKKSSKGFVDSKTPAFLELYNTKVNKLGISFSQIQSTLGEQLLPSASKIIDIFADTVFYVSDMIAKYEELG
jgi:TP901 family phage tail tape measure protein